MRASQPTRLRGKVQFGQVTVTKDYFVDLSSYPPWLLALVGTVLVVVFLWILIKVLKWTLWLLLICVLVGGVGWSGWLLLH